MGRFGAGHPCHLQGGTIGDKKVKTIEKEKVVPETLNGRFAMLGLIAAVGAYLTTGQIIPGFV